MGSAITLIKKRNISFIHSKLEIDKPVLELDLYVEETDKYKNDLVDLDKNE